VSPALGRQHGAKDKRRRKRKRSGHVARWERDRELTFPNLRLRWSGRETTTRKLWTCERSASVGLPIAPDKLRRRRKFEKYLRHPATPTALLPPHYVRLAPNVPNRRPLERFGCIGPRPTFLGAPSPDRPNDQRYDRQDHQASDDWNNRKATGNFIHRNPENSLTLRVLDPTRLFWQTGSGWQVPALDDLRWRKLSRITQRRAALCGTGSFM